MGDAGAGAEDESGIRKTPCPMLRRFRISTGRKPCRVYVSQRRRYVGNGIISQEVV